MYAPQHAAANPDKPAIIMASTGKVITYAEYEARANQTAQLFRRLGLKNGDTIALVLSNSAEYLICKGGAERSGLRYVCVNTHLKSDELEYIINDSESTVVVADAVTLPQLEGLIDRCTAVQHWLAVGTDAPEPFTSYDEQVAEQSAEPIADERLGGGMLYSSGTTGRPKGILRPIPDASPQDNLPVYQFTNMIFRLTPDMVYLSSAPLYHSAPHSAMIGAIRLGATAIVMEKFDPEELLRLVEKYQVTTTQVVPTMLGRIWKLGRDVRKKYDTSTLTTVVHGAAPMPPELKRQIIDEWGLVLYEYYGATEGHGFCMADSEEWLHRPGTVGKAVLGELVIRDDEGNELPPGREGTIWFRGATNFFYKGDEEKTKAAMAEGGNMATVEDVGYLDEDGYLYLTDRKTFMIISGGVNIYPQEVEDLLAVHPDVADCAVIGVPDEDFGEQVKAVVIREPGAKSDDELASELMDYCKQHLATYKCPRSVDFVEALPRTPTGKLQKKLVRANYWPS